jgi:hypothetical protein
MKRYRWRYPPGSHLISFSESFSNPFSYRFLSATIPMMHTVDFLQRWDSNSFDQMNASMTAVTLNNEGTSANRRKDFLTALEKFKQQ